MCPKRFSDSQRRHPAAEPARRLEWPLRGALACLLLLGIAALGYAASAQTEELSRPASPTVTIRGTLGTAMNEGPLLRAGGSEYILQGQSPYLLHVLEDKRLLNQQLELKGTPGTGRTFVVSRIYAVREGKLYKIQYYCNVCNITYVQPGHCYCCGRETALQEVPVSEANP